MRSGGTGILKREYVDGSSFCVIHDWLKFPEQLTSGRAARIADQKRNPKKAKVSRTNDGGSGTAAGDVNLNEAKARPAPFNKHLLDVEMHCGGSPQSLTT